MKTKKVPETVIGEFSNKTFMLQKPKQLAMQAKNLRNLRAKEEKLR